MFFDVAIIICTYNSSWSKVKNTIDSCLMQKGLRFQIVISDDGSKDNMFDDIDEYFKSKNFMNYLLIPAVENQGTVMNIYKGIKATRAHYIKFIGQGDCFTTDNVLSKWVKEISRENNKWSFGNAIYIDENKRIISKVAHPQIVETYVKKDDERCRWNYLVLEDIALGATMLSERETTLKYLELIKGKVIYAEDNIWRLMMYDGIVPCFYNCNVVYYEYGTGISTKNESKWGTILRKDWETTNLIMNGLECNSKLQKNILKNINCHTHNFFYKFYKMFVCKGKLLYKLKYKYYPRMTEKE